MSAKIKDLTGLRFDKLTVVKLAAKETWQITKGKYKELKPYWECLCSCGKTRIRSGSYLRSSKVVKSCGCTRKSFKGRLDLTNKKFGLLTCLTCEKIQELNKKTKYQWICKCDCGNIIHANHSKLIANKKTSCGCRGEVLESGELEIGSKKGYLTILGFIGKNRNGLDYVKPSTPIGENLFKLKCDCGNMIGLTKYQVLAPSRLSCGLCSMTKMNPEAAAYNHLENTYKSSAKRRKTPYELSFSDFKELITSNCFYCGIEPKQIIDKRDHPDFLYNGIDKINPSNGYTKENCVSCCGKCNRMKLDHSQEDFYVHIKKIYEFNSL